VTDAKKTKDLQRLRKSIPAWNRWRRRSRSTPDFSGADLSGEDLSNADLSRAKLKGTNLSRAILKGAILSDATLEGANLNRANLFEANFARANLKNAHMILVNVEGADFSDADLSGAELYGAVAEAAKFDRALVVGTRVTAGSPLEILLAPLGLKSIRAEIKPRQSRPPRRMSPQDRLEVVLAPDITPQEIADVLHALNVLHLADSGRPLSDPVIRIGFPDEVFVPGRSRR
jgi:hypothetical protein